MYNYNNTINILYNITNIPQISFYINGHGIINIDWGDGVIESILGPKLIEHNYSNINNIKKDLYYSDNINIKISSNDSITTFNIRTPKSISHIYNIPILELDIDCPNLVDGSNMLYDIEYGSYCGLLRRFSLSKVEKILNSQNMFRDCKSLRSIELSGFNSCIDMSNMFMGCSNLQYIKFDNDLDRVICIDNMFNGCNSLLFFHIPKMKKLLNANNVFVDCYNLRFISGLDVFCTNIVSMSNFMVNCLEYISNLIIGCGISKLSLINLPKLTILGILGKLDFKNTTKPNIYLDNVSIYTDCINNIITENNLDYNTIIYINNCKNFNINKFNNKVTLLDSLKKM